MTASEDQFDDRYVRFREHADVRERVTALEGNSTQVMAYLARIEAMLNARAPAVAASAPQETAMAAVLHRALELAEKRQPGGSTILPWVLVGALGVLAGAMALGAFT